MRPVMAKSGMPKARLLLVFSAAVVSSCHDEAIAPIDVAGASRWYQLSSVNGQQLPIFVSPPDYGSTINRSDLLLRADGTFGLGVEGKFGWFVSGTYTESGNRLTLAAPPFVNWPLVQLGGELSLHSLLVTGAVPYVYDIAPTPPPFLKGEKFALHTINGRGEPLTWVDITVADGRFITRISFDTISFDGFFYRQHRMERRLSYPTLGDSGVYEETSLTHGTYEKRGDAVVLRPYEILSFSSTRDSLVIAGQELIRRTDINPGIVEERYRRIPQ
jgi:hypothetical protein